MSEPFDLDHLRIDDFDLPITVRAVDDGRPGRYLAFNKALFATYRLQTVPEGPEDLVGFPAGAIEAIDQQVIDTQEPAEMQVTRFEILISLSKNPVVRDGRVVAILTVSTDITDLATTSSQRDLLAVAAQATEDRLSLYRITPDGNELVFANRAAAELNERLTGNKRDHHAERAVQLLEAALDEVVATGQRRETQLELSDEICLVRDDPLVNAEGGVAGVARSISNINEAVSADWTEQLLEIATLDDTAEAVERTFDVGCHLLQLPVGVLAELLGDELIIHGRRQADLLPDRLPAHTDFTGTLERGEVMLFRDLERMNAAGPIITTLGLRSMAAIPISVDGVKWGLLAFGGLERRSDRFPTRTIPLLGALGGTLSSMLERDAARRKLVPVELLRKSNRELEEYAYAAAHDLRSPLRSMSSFSQLLKAQLGRNPEDTDRLFHYADRIISGADQMTDLLQSMLEHARSGEGSDGSDIADFDQLLTLVVEASEEHLQRLQAEVTRGPLPVLAVNSVQFQRVLHNLIDNALKYRAPDRPPRIHVAADTESDPAHVLISVTDNGIGIPPEQRDLVFGLFKRLSGDGEGTGVGLAVVRRIVEENGGSITVDQAPTHGSVFTISLPHERLITPTGA